MEEVTDGTKDKRSWRERLGIGKGASNLPKLEDEMRQSAAASPASAKPAAPGKMRMPARPAPMAPRVAAKPPSGPKPGVVGVYSNDPRPAPNAVPPTAAKPAQPPRQPPVAADALASKLRDQREAAERLALQRVTAAKQKAEGGANPAAAAVAPGPVAGEKPKFTFADAAQPAPIAPAAQRPTGPRPLPPLPPQVPQEAARRTSAQPAMVPPPMQPARQPLGANPGLPPQGAFAAGPGRFPPQGYRPIDPAAGGYAPPPGFRPRPSVAPAYQDTLGAPRGYRAPPPRYADQGQRGPLLPMGPAVGPYQDDVFEEAPRSPPRRATAGEYQQAFRDEYLDDEPRGMGWGVWVAAFALAVLVALGAVYALKPQLLPKTGLSGTAGKPAVVEAPATPVKSAPDAAAASGGDAVARKQIYDRIEGDHEVPGGQLKGSEQAPQPVGQSAPQPTGDNAVPLPLPPPPGTGQQGALGPDGKGDIASANEKAAAPSAADSSQIAVQTTPNQTPVPPADAAGQGVGAPNQSGVAAAGSNNAAAPKPLDAIVPAPPQAAKPAAVKPAQAPAAAKLPNDAQDAAPAAADAKAGSKKPKLVAEGKFKSLGSKPVVLVAPGTADAKVPVTPAPISPLPKTGAAGVVDLYGNGGSAVAPAPGVPAPKVAAVAPAAPVPSLPSGIGYVVQLASYASRADAQSAYAQLAAKHGGVVSRYASIIEPTQVAGSTRYRLNLGPIANSETAASVCATLIAAGERDCLTKKQ